MPSDSRIRVRRPRARARAWSGSGLVVAALVALALPGSAPAYVYWTNAEDGTIGRADLDGGGVRQDFVTGADEPNGIAVDPGHIYWADPGAGTIGRADLDGSAPDPEFITGPVWPYGVAVDAGHIYWGDYFDHSIGRANLDGSEDISLIDTVIQGPVGVAVDAGHVYWANAQTSLGRADLDGSAVEREFITGARHPWEVAVDGSHVYWANDFGASIGRARLDGSAADQAFVTGADRPRGLAVDADHVYWTNWEDGTIGRADLDGSEPDPAFIAGADRPIGVAVDSLPHASATAVACAPAALVLPATARCTATVVDRGPFPSPPGPLVPSGTVSFSSAGGGAFAPGASCAPAPLGAGRSACAVSFIPAAPGLVSIQAAYGGDSTHRPSNAAAPLVTGAADAGVVAPVTATPGALGPAVGIATAARVARVRGGRALMRLRCRGVGPCHGALRLVFRLRRKQGSDGGRSGTAPAAAARRQGRRALLGRAPFAIGAGERTTVSVGLSRRARALLRRAGRRGLKALLRGRGIEPGRVSLRPARRASRAA